MSLRSSSIQRESLSNSISLDEECEEMPARRSARRSDSSSEKKKKSKKKSSASAGDDGDDNDSEEEPRSVAASITIKQFEPNAKYIANIKVASNEEEKYKVYIREREAYEFSPAFFFDCCDYFYQQGNRKIALRILTNIMELEMENAQLYRIIGYKLDTENELDLAIQMFEK